MEPVKRNEVLGLGDYEAIRPHFRARVIEEKKARRFSVGPHATVVLENHDTVLLQIQEMLRTERITKEAAIQHEIDVYNELVPKNGELSFTLMFEISDKEEREAFLFRAKDVEKNMELLVDGFEFPIEWDKTRESPDRTSAVHYLKVKLGEQAVVALRRGMARAGFVIDHDAYRHTAPLPQTVLASIAEDLADYTPQKRD
jgi:hypothetical protein